MAIEHTNCGGWCVRRATAREIAAFPPFPAAQRQPFLLYDDTPL